MTREESISEVDSVIYKLSALIDDLNDCKKDFIDFDGEYFPDQLKISDPDNIKILGFFEAPSGIPNGLTGVQVLFLKQWVVYSKYFHIDIDELKNVKRIKAIDKMLA